MNKDQLLLVSILLFQKTT